VNPILLDEPRSGLRFPGRRLPRRASLVAFAIVTLSGGAHAEPPPAAVAPTAPAAPTAPPPPSGAASASEPPPAPGPQPSPGLQPPPGLQPSTSPSGATPPAGDAATAPPFRATSPQGFVTPWSLPQELPYKEGTAVPRGYHLEERHTALLPVLGGVLFASAYGLCSAFAGSGLRNAEYGYIPFAGPFIAMATVEAPYKGDTTVAAFVLTGIGELAGAAILVYGLYRTESWLVQNQKAARLMVAPWVLGKAGGGLVVGGAF
jgi:hypothetical protein